MQEKIFSKEKLQIILGGGFLVLIPFFLGENWDCVQNGRHFGNNFVPFYLLFSIFLCWLIKPLFYRKLGFRKFWFSFAIRLLFSILMTLLLLEKYEGGDFGLYYFLSRDLADSFFSQNWDEISKISFSLQFIPPLIFGFFFIFFPPSIYGLTIISGLIVHISNLFVFKILQNFIGRKNLFFVLFFLIPTITLNSSYVGKETLVIPIISVLIVLIYWGKEVSWTFFLLFLFLFFIRPYNAAFLFLSLFLSKIFQGKIKNIIFTLPLGLIILLTVLSKASTMMNLPNFSFSAIVSKVGEAYQGGSLMLKPFPFPFLLLQSFRPFPWEVHNLFSFVVSIEAIILMVLFVFYFVVNRRNIVFNFFSSTFFRFLFFYSLIQFFIFSFDENMGDLIRRKVYYFPFLFFLILANRIRPKGRLKF